jgi:ABC-type glutathione transport system ATPase component
MALLEVENLEIAVSSKGKLLPIVQGVSFDVDDNETLGVVGESGCGKSLTSLAIMGLLGGTTVRITNGNIRFEGVDLLTLPEKDRRSHYGQPNGNDLSRANDQPESLSIVSAIKSSKTCASIKTFPMPQRGIVRLNC